MNAITIVLAMLGVLLVSTLPSLLLWARLKNLKHQDALFLICAAANAAIAMILTGGITYLFDSWVSYLTWLAAMYSMARYGFHVATTVVSHFTILFLLKAALITLFTAIMYTFLLDTYNRAYAEMVLVATAIVLFLVGSKKKQSNEVTFSGMDNGQSTLQKATTADGAYTINHGGREAPTLTIHRAMTDQEMEGANKEYTKALEQWATINGDPQPVMQTGVR